MNFDEAKALLSRIQIHDNRNVTAIVIEHWADILRDITYREAVWAFRDFVTSNERDYLKPAHLTNVIYQKRSEYSMMNPSNRNYAIDAWVDFEEGMESISRANALRYPTTGPRYAVDVIDAIELTPEDARIMNTELPPQ